MNILISADAEGISWTTHGSQVLKEGNDFNLFREIYTAEINSIVEGAIKGGVDNIILTDSHDSGRNIIYSKLQRKIKLITGTPRPLSMVEGLNLADKLFLFGYHSKSGTLNGVLNHTYSTIVHKLIINGIEMGEIGLSAAVAGKFGKNVTFVAGDRSAISEAMEILEDFEYVVLKEGISRYSAITYSYEDSIEMLKEAAYNATKRVGKTFRLKEPILMEIEFINTGMADYASLIPLFERVNGYRIKIKANDIIEAYKYFRAALVLASSDHGGYWGDMNEILCFFW